MFGDLLVRLIDPRLGSRLTPVTTPRPGTSPIHPSITPGPAHASSNGKRRDDDPSNHKYTSC